VPLLETFGIDAKNNDVATWQNFLVELPAYFGEIFGVPFQNLLRVLNALIHPKKNDILRFKLSQKE
jgi:hypothetical protein